MPSRLPGSPYTNLTRFCGGILPCLACFTPSDSDLCHMVSESSYPLAVRAVPITHLRSSIDATDHTFYDADHSVEVKTSPY